MTWPSSVPPPPLRLPPAAPSPPPNRMVKDGGCAVLIGLILVPLMVWSSKALAMPINWNGPAVTERLKRAQLAGVNACMGGCVVQAKNNHAWRNRSGVLEGGIGIVEFAAAQGTGVQGTWGVQDVRYALIHELGGVIRPVAAKALAFKIGDRWVFAKSVTIPARPYLRPAADAIYPSLAARIREAYQSAGQSPGLSSGGSPDE